MNATGYLLVALLVALPAAWLIAEFKASRTTRITLGLVSLAWVTIFTYGLSSFLVTLNYNTWFGHSTNNLIETSVTQLEQDRADHVLKVWKELNKKYSPTYENRADYKGLVDEATQALRESGTNNVSEASSLETGKK